MFKRTLQKPVEIEGEGLLSGRRIALRFLPLEKGETAFVRVDLPERPVIPASVDYATHQFHATFLEKDGIRIRVVEHVLATLYGLGIDRVLIEINGDEPPVLDGSALPYAQLLKEGGIKELNEEREEMVISCPFCVGEGDSYILLTPSSSSSFAYYLDFPHPLLSGLYREIDFFSEHSFIQEIAPARTFGFERDVAPLLKKGFYRGGNLENTILLDEEKVLSPSLRFPDEFVRHKILDLMGDLYLSGVWIKRGLVKGVRSGHGLNLKLAKRLKEGKAMEERVMEIEEIMKILPHRYPFLFVDKILFLGDKRAVGMKNLTMNEEFFQGHFPGYPIMPAVIMLEAMAQVGGVLLLSKSENQGRIAYFAGVENARFRKPVRPGDQLVTEVEIIRLKKKVGRVRAVATVEGEKVAEAEFLFSLAER